MVGVFLLVVGALEIVAPDCPSAEAILAHWATLGVDPPVGHAVVSVDDAHLQLTLRADNGALLADRRLHAPPDCDQRAAIAAVVLAAWSPPSAPPTITAPPLPTPAPPMPRLSSRAVAPRRRDSLEVAASFVAAIDPSGFAPGASAEAAFAPRQTAWWGHLSLSGGGTRTITVGEGSARYTRAFATLGPRRRFTDGAWHIDLEADASFALVYLSGSGFLTDRAGYAFDFGLGAGLRVGRRFAAWMPFFAARVVGWVTQQDLVIGGESKRAELPRVDGLLSTGIAFDR